MKPFLDNIANRLISKHPKDMDSLIIVLPSKRAELFLKNYLSHKIKSPVFLPKFYTIEEFLEKLSGLHIIDNLSLYSKFLFC